MLGLYCVWEYVAFAFEGCMCLFLRERERPKDRIIASVTRTYPYEFFPNIHVDNLQLQYPYEFFPNIRVDNLQLQYS